jgi:hypothetical protein
MGYVSMEKPMTDELTAFAASLVTLRKKYSDAKINAREFQRKIKPCSLSSCRGMCCYDGASVDKETGAEIQKLAAERRSEFETMGLHLPNHVIEESDFSLQISGKRLSGPLQRNRVRISFD